MYDYKKDDDTCVEVNIFVKCKDGSWKKVDRNDELCVKVNIHIDCDKDEKKKRCGCDED